MFSRKTKFNLYVLSVVYVTAIFIVIMALSIEHLFPSYVIEISVRRRSGNGERINKTLLPSKYFQNQIKVKYCYRSIETVSVKLLQLASIII